MTSVLMGRGEDTQKHREKGDVKTEAEARVTHCKPRAAGHWWKLGQARDGVSFGASEGNRLAFGLLASGL